MPTDARLELLGRLPQPESLLLLGRQGHSFRNFSDLRSAAEAVMARSEKRSAALAIMDRLVELHARCQRQTNSMVIPMGDEMFYRYQQALIEEATTTAGALLLHSSNKF